MYLQGDKGGISIKVNMCNQEMHIFTKIISKYVLSVNWSVNTQIHKTDF